MYFPVNYLDTICYIIFIRL